MAYQIFRLLFVRTTGTDLQHDLQHGLQHNRKKLKFHRLFELSVQSIMGATDRRAAARIPAPSCFICFPEGSSIVLFRLFGRHIRSVTPAGLTMGSRNRTCSPGPRRIAAPAGHFKSRGRENGKPPGGGEPFLKQHSSITPMDG